MLKSSKAPACGQKVPSSKDQFGARVCDPQQPGVRTRCGSQTRAPNAMEILGSCGVFDGEEDELQAAGFLVEAAGVDEEFALAEFVEFVFEAKIPHFALGGELFLQELLEARDVPLAV